MYISLASKEVISWESSVTSLFTTFLPFLLNRSLSLGEREFDDDLHLRLSVRETLCTWSSCVYLC